MTLTELWLRDIARVSGVPYELLRSRRRKQHIVRLRQAVMFVMVRKLKIGYASAGRRLDGRDHTTVIHGVDTMDMFLRRKNPLAVRCYRIAIRCYIRTRNAERERVESLIPYSNKDCARAQQEIHRSAADALPGSVPLLRQPAPQQVAA